ncbi:MAG TPA: response regulator transcription factor [Ktedonobacteraceae bacterium]|nr:response regulator transcription factor [Ktedonobacteraceae bacterium]
MDHFHSHYKQEIFQHAPGVSQREKLLRVLIVDDHEIFRHGLRDLINRIQRFQVVAEAGSSTAALAVAASTSLDVIFIDLSLPGESGLSIIPQLKQVNPHLSIIVLSETMTNETLLEAMLSGADGYLTKDIPAVEIMNILLGYLQGAPTMLPAVANNLIHQLVKKCNELSCRGDSLEGQILRCAQNDRLRTHPGISGTCHSSLRSESIMHDLNSTKSKEPLLSPLPPSAKPVFVGSSTTPLQTLTPQEEKVFHLMRQGQSNKDIATQLSISHYTVGKHVQSILRKLHVKNRTQAVTYTSFEGGENRGNDE